MLERLVLAGSYVSKNRWYIWKLSKRNHTNYTLSVSRKEITKEVHNNFMNWMNTIFK